jgi:hypothetical protein
MLVALILFIPVLALVVITVWAFYRCRAQAAAPVRRPAHPVTVVKSGVEEFASEKSRPCLEFMDSYFQRGPMILGGRNGDWSLTHHLTQVRRRHWRPPESLMDQQQQDW